MAIGENIESFSEVGKHCALRAATDETSTTNSTSLSQPEDGETDWLTGNGDFEIRRLRSALCYVGVHLGIDGYRHL